MERLSAARRNSEIARLRQASWIEGTFLRSRFGRRIFLMFCIAALVPALLLFWMTYGTAVDEARNAHQAAMRSNSKNFALSIFERLETAYQVLERASPGDGNAPFLSPFFSDVSIIDLERTSNRNMDALASRLPVEPMIAAGLRLVVQPVPEPSDAARIVLLRPVTVEGDRKWFAATMRPGFLWGNADEFALDGSICVNAGTQRLFCGGDLARASTDGAMQAEWALFLKPRFGAPAWTFVTTAKAPPILEGYPRALALIAACVLLLVMLLSSIQIRRVLVPLEALLARIQSIGHAPQAGADAPASDEFGMLMQTFNAMGQRIGLQMNTLRTLSELDRLILERVPVPVVVEVVIAGIRSMVADATIGVILPDAKGSGAPLNFLRARAAQATETGDAASLASVSEAWVAGESTQKGWLPDTWIGSALRRDGAERAFAFPVGRSGQVQPWVVLGFPQGVIPTDESLMQAGELAERIAVAIAADDRENLLIFQARHDALTGLPNRLAAFEALQLAVTRAEQSGDNFAVAFLDLDRFKSINDGLGHAHGDAILIQAGARIIQHLRSSDFVARFGGDEFFLILQRISSADDALRVMGKVTAGFDAPIKSEEVELFLQFSAGIAFYPSDGADANALIHNSDVAMYRAKKSGGDRIEFFDEAMSNEAVLHVQLENNLRLAIRNATLHVHYQPRVDSRSGRIVAVEALARWTDPVSGNIPPSTFIGLAEECGLIDDLGALVLKTTCRQLADWQRAGFDVPLVAVNVSSHQLRSGKFVEIVRQAVDESGIAWRDLELEVTESLLIHDSGSVARQLRHLRELGITVAIDDFGTGYSSLAYLSKLPTDTLKIDRAFMADIERDPTSVAVVRSIIAMAQALDKKIVAEGVESEAQVELLAAWGCHIIQGFVYYTPLAPDVLMQHLARKNEAPMH